MDLINFNYLIMKMFIFTILCLFQTLFINAQNCDNIILNDGTEIPSIIQEIKLDEITYKKCENISGPLYIILKSEVFMLKYNDGSKEIITNYSENTISPENNFDFNNKSFKDLSSEQKNELLTNNNCFLIVPFPENGTPFSATIIGFKKISTSFRYCNSKGIKQLNNIYIDYIKSEKGEIIYFNGNENYNKTKE